MLILSKIKNALSIIAAFIGAAVMVFLFGKASVPKELTIKEVQKIKKRVKDDQQNKNVFDKLADIDNSIDSL